MRPWEKLEYQKFKNVRISGNDLVIDFQNDDVVSISKQSIGLNTDTIQWHKIDFNAFEIILQDESGEKYLIPWDKIRVISDPDFSKFLAEEAEEQAKAIGQKLKVLRIQKGFRSKELAERASLTPQSISRIEKGKQDVNFKTLRKLLAVMGYSLKDLAEVELVPETKTFQFLAKRLQTIGIPKSLLLERLIPQNLTQYFNQSLNTNSEIILDEIGNVIEKIFGISNSKLWSNESLYIDDNAYSKAFYKMPNNSNSVIVKAYSQYVYFLSSIILKATSRIERKKYPESIEELKEQFFAKYETLDYVNILRYIWDIGICVLPLSDSGQFHGASWNINGRHIIIVKQRTDSHARWIFDLLHELYHVFQHLDKSDTSVLEFQEITPLETGLDEEELEANAFANEVIFNRKEDDYAQMCVIEAQGKTENLKSAVMTISEQENIRIDFLANHLAFRLQQQNQNWWGTAENLQVKTPSPFGLSKKLLIEKIDTNKLTNFENSLLERALIKL